MPAAVRVNDACSGHDLCPPRPAVSGSPNVFINGRPADGRLSYRLCQRPAAGQGGGWCQLRFDCRRGQPECLCRLNRFLSSYPPAGGFFME